MLPSPDRLGIAATVPAPELLGIGGVPPTNATGPLDWAVARKRLQDLGALTFHLEHPGPTQFQFSIMLPTAQAGKPFLVEADGATDADAVNAALARAEKWRSGKP